MATTRTSSVQKFLQHKTQERSGGFLKDWKENGTLNNWLHMSHVPEAVWSHPWPTIVVKEDRDTKEQVVHVWSRSYVCPEPETVLKKQYRREDETGERKVAPRFCGVCRFVDWVYMQILNGALAVETPVFRLEGDIEKERVTLYAAGICNQLKKDKLSPAALSRINKLGISLRDGFKQNMMAKANYIAVIVDDAAPGDGAQIATIASSLGDKIKEVITDSMIEAGETKGDSNLGDPFLHPFMFQWVYREDEEDPQKKYRVRKISKEPSDLVREVIEGDPIDLSAQFAPMNQKSIRMLMEKACLLKGKNAPPWDELFDVKPSPKQRDADDDDAGVIPDSDGSPRTRTTTSGRAKPAEREEDEEPAPKRAKAKDDEDDFPPSYDEKPSAKKTPEELVASIPEEDLYECTVEGCGRGSPTADECVWCGAKFDDQGNVIAQEKEEPPPPPKQMKTRGAPKEPEPEAPKGKKKFKANF